MTDTLQRVRPGREHTAPGRGGYGVGLGAGLGMGYLCLMVGLPVAAVAAKAATPDAWSALASPQARSALVFSLGAALVAAAINLVAGVLLAWVLVRDTFPGRRFVDALIDLPFALPTIVAGLVLLTLYGPGSPIGVNVAQTRAAVVLALLFVTLPFVVRSVQPVLLSVDRDAEDAAACLGASPATTFRRVILPAILPAALTGAGLAFARALGEFGSVVLISGNLPFKTQVASVYIAGQVESGDSGGAAAVSLVLLATSLVVLAGLTAVSRRVGARHG